MESNKRVLFVDDERSILRAAERSLRDVFEIVTTTDPKEALSLLASQRPFGVVVSDYMMRGLDGLQFLNLTRQRYPETERILMTGYAGVDLAVSAVNEAKVHSIITKPFTMELVERELSAGCKSITHGYCFLHPTKRPSIQWERQSICGLDSGHTGDCRRSRFQR